MTSEGSRPHRPWSVIVAAAVIVAAVGIAWALQATASDVGEPQDRGSPTSYTITIKKGGEVLKTYDLAALHALPQTSVVIDGKRQDGPLLETVLADAGATPVRRVLIRGAGLRDSGRLTLTSSQVARRVQLDFTYRGTVKACGPRLDRGEWVRDVVSIDAE